MMKAAIEAMENLAESPKTVSKESFAQMLLCAHGVMPETNEYTRKRRMLTMPAITKLFAIFFPYTSPITSVMMNTIGNENTATERCVPNKKGIVLMPRVFAAKSEVI